MSIELKAGPTSLERLEAAVARMVQKHGFLEIAPNFPVATATVPTLPPG